MSCVHIWSISSTSSTYIHTYRNTLYFSTSLVFALGLNWFTYFWCCFSNFSYSLMNFGIFDSNSTVGRVLLTISRIIMLISASSEYYALIILVSWLWHHLFPLRVDQSAFLCSILLYVALCWPKILLLDLLFCFPFRLSYIESSNVWHL